MDKYISEGNQDPMQAIRKAAAWLREQGARDPEVGIILGSGLGGYEDRLQERREFPYAEIPGFAVSTAPGHRGTLYYGIAEGKRVLVMSGRFHFYEGYPMNTVIFPVRVMACLGVKRLIITNAAGSINLTNGAGKLMMISDHINLSGTNPLIGPNVDALGTRFPDMTETYSKVLRERVIEEAGAAGIDLCEGVYAMMSGPSFETPAEIRFLRAIGADAVGMSSVPEAIAARHAGMEIAAISCLANMAAGVLDQPLDGAEVLEAANRVSRDFAEVVDIAVRI